MGKTAFWKCRVIKTGHKSKSEKSVLDCYIKSVVSYGCETWTFNQTIPNKIDAFQLWCYRRMLKIKCTDHVTNKKVKEIMDVEKTWSEELAKRKLRYAGYIMRGSSGMLVQLVLEGFIEGKKGRGKPKRMWGDDLKEWTNCDSIELVKRRSEDRTEWRNMVHCLRLRRRDADWLNIEWLFSPTGKV